MNDIIPLIALHHQHPIGVNVQEASIELHKQQEPPQRAALVRVFRDSMLLLLCFQLDVGMLALGTLNGVAIATGQV